MKKTSLGKQAIRSLEKGLFILEAISSKSSSVGVRELAREIDLSSASVSRYLSTLHHAKYLEQDPETGRYRLGPRVVGLAISYAQQNPISKIAHRVFEDFSDRFEYNFYYGILREFEVIYVSVLDGRGPIKIVEIPGAASALHATALGKVLLAYQEEDYVESYLKRGVLTRFTARTITDQQEIRELIQEVRRQGYAVNDGEEYDEIAAIAAPVFDPRNHVIGSVSLAYPRGLIDRQRVEEMKSLVKQIAREIGERTSG